MDSTTSSQNSKSLLTNGVDLDLLDSDILDFIEDVEPGTTSNEQPIKMESPPGTSLSAGSDITSPENTSTGDAEDKSVSPSQVSTPPSPKKGKFISTLVPVPPEMISGNVLQVCTKECFSFLFAVLL